MEKLLNDLDELEKSNLLTKDEIRKYFDDLGGYDALMKYKEKELSNIDLK
ncbi:hypothetical protein KBC03_04350 [Patescibacteria group bacterium]|nr:hypothetical protein [Patescibacteria group bacterium]